MKCTVTSYRTKQFFIGKSDRSNSFQGKAGKGHLVGSVLNLMRVMFRLYNLFIMISIPHRGLCKPIFNKSSMNHDLLLQADTIALTFYVEAIAFPISWNLLSVMA